MTAGFDNICASSQADKKQNFEVSMVLRNMFAFDINVEFSCTLKLILFYLHRPGSRPWNPATSVRSEL